MVAGFRRDPLALAELKKMLAQLTQGLTDHDAVFVKASNGMGLKKIVEGLRKASE